MPMNRDLYPAEWDEISLRIRERDGWTCQHCGLANGARIYRYQPNKAKWITEQEWQAADWGRRSKYPKLTVVILTVHHIGVSKPDGSPGDPRDKMDCRDENLTSLCQRCHLLADLPHHMEQAAATRRRNKLERRLRSGQMELEIAT